MFFYGDVQRPELKFQPFTPKPLHLSRKSADIFDELRHRDILLHHPYDSYDAGGGVCAAGRAGSGGRDDEADALPHQQRLADVPGADRGRRRPRKRRWWWS